jgi:predicted DNA-binding protein YlxM (UPF0122 family)
MAEQVWIVLGDVVDSRSIEARQRFEADLDSVLARINQEYESEILSPFTRLKGIDEIGGVLASVASLVAIQREITLGVHPEEIRLVVVRGPVERVEVTDIREMDGQGFVDAAERLQAVESAGTTFALSGFDTSTDNQITAAINLLDLVRHSWTERRVEVLQTYHDAETQTEVAAELGVTRQAISAHLNAKSVERVQHVESLLATELRSRSFTSFDRS